MDEAKKIGIVVADDHPIMRTAIKRVLEKNPDFWVMGEANDGLEAVFLASRLQPAILLLDMEMPRLDGVEVIEQLSRHKSRVKVVALSAHLDNYYIQGVMRSGAAGYLVKEESAEFIAEAIRRVSQGEKPIFSPIVRHVISQFDP